MLDQRENTLYYDGNGRIMIRGGSRMINTSCRAVSERTARLDY